MTRLARTLVFVKQGKLRTPRECSAPTLLSGMMLYARMCHNVSVMNIVLAGLCMTGTLSHQQWLLHPVKDDLWPRSRRLRLSNLSMCPPDETRLGISVSWTGRILYSFLCEAAEGAHWPAPLAHAADSEIKPPLDWHLWLRWTFQSL